MAGSVSLFEQGSYPKTGTHFWETLPKHHSQKMAFLRFRKKHVPAKAAMIREQGIKAGPRPLANVEFA